jgi:phosphate starvation-inducible PhoH-like protein
VEATRVLDGVEGIGFMAFSKADVVRHPLVQSIIHAYERRGSRSGSSRGGRGSTDSGGNGGNREGR